MSSNRKRKPAICAVVAPLLFVAACSDSGASPTGPRLVVLYSTCTVSKDFLSPYRPGIPYTPNLQRFADESVVFERHNSEAGQSGIAFASIYSGVQADRHGIFHHPRPLADELYLVGEAFRDNGYATHFWSGHGMAAASLNYGQGIAPDHVYDHEKQFTKRAQTLDDDFLTRTTANGPELDAVLADLAADPDAHAFLQINFTITHELYHEYAGLEKIEAFRKRYPAHATDLTTDEIRAGLAFFEANRHTLQLNHAQAVDALGMSPADVARLDTVLQLAYATCIAQLDDYLGRFLGKIDAAGLTEDSLVAFTADHGETFYHPSEPFHWMHGMQLAPTVVEVPWIVRGRSSGVVPSRFPGVTRSIDVFPTLAGLADLALPENVRLAGVDLSSVARGAAPTADQAGLVAFTHTTTIGEKRLDRYKRERHRTAIEWLPEPRPEFVWVRLRDGDMVFELRPDGDGGMDAFAFDLATDRFRDRNLFDGADATHARCIAELREYRARLIAAFDPTETLGADEIGGRLQGLGYIGDDPDE